MAIRDVWSWFSSQTFEQKEVISLLSLALFMALFSWFPTRENYKKLFWARTVFVAVQASWFLPLLICFRIGILPVDIAYGVNVFYWMFIGLIVVVWHRSWMRYFELKLRLGRGRPWRLLN